MYVVCHHPLGFISDAPTEYTKFPDVTEFISKIPVVWNETLPLEARIGEYLITARRTGTDWYVAGLTNWTGRNAEINLSFLTEGMKYKAQIMKDVPEKNNDKGFRAGDATAYTLETIDVDNNTVLNIDMAQGGGFVIHIYPDKGSSIHKDVSPHIRAWYDDKAKVIHIDSKTEDLQVRLTNLLGKTVKMCIAGREAVIPVNEIPHGTYILTCIMENQEKNVKIAIY